MSSTSIFFSEQFREKSNIQYWLRYVNWFG